MKIDSKRTTGDIEDVVRFLIDGDRTVYAQEVEQAVQAAIWRTCGNNEPKKAVLLLASQELTEAMVGLVRRLSQAGRSIEVTPALGIYTLARIEKTRTCGDLRRLIRYLIIQANEFLA